MEKKVDIKGLFNLIEKMFTHSVITYWTKLSKKTIGSSSPPDNFKPKLDTSLGNSFS